MLLVAVSSLALYFFSKYVRPTARRTGRIEFEENCEVLEHLWKRSRVEMMINDCMEGVLIRMRIARCWSLYGRYVERKR